MELEETLLPGVGVRYELKTRSGQLLGIVVQREGGAEIAVYDRRDPDRARGVFRLTAEESDAVAEVLGAPAAHPAVRRPLHRRCRDWNPRGSPSRPGSPFDGRSLGDTRARTLTGCSIVAIVRDADVVPPDPRRPAPRR